MLSTLVLLAQKGEKTGREGRQVNNKPKCSIVHSITKIHIRFSRRPEKVWIEMLLPVFPNPVNGTTTCPFH